MQTALVDVGAKVTQIGSPNQAPRERIPAPFRRLEGCHYLVIQQAFRATGGVASGDQVAYLLRERLEQPISVVARWIVAREVVSYEWRSQTMLPLFQFDMPRVALRSSVAGVIRELKDVYADWCLAMWFVEPNSWLDGATPIQTIETSPRAVLDAARADRLVANR